MNTLLVTAYTPGYRDLYQRLAESCKAHGAELWSMPYESTGSWERNGHVKPRALLEAMRQHPGRPVCWVDADAILRAPPVLLDGLEWSADVAWHVVPKTSEDLSGTVWLDSGCFSFLREWALALVGTEMWDQRAMLVAAQRSQARTVILPAEYLLGGLHGRPPLVRPPDPGDRAHPGLSGRQVWKEGDVSEPSGSWVDAFRVLHPSPAEKERPKSITVEFTKEAEVRFELSSASSGPALENCIPCDAVHPVGMCDDEEGDE